MIKQLFREFNDGKLIAKDEIYKSFEGYQHIQDTPSYTWEINHNIGDPFKINVFVNGEEVNPSEIRMDVCTTTLVFGEQISGFANLAFLLGDTNECQIILPTPDVSLSSTPTPTQTPTNAPLLSASTSNTPTPTASSSLSGSVTPTPTPTVSSSASVTPTILISLSASPTPTPTVSSSASVTPTPTPSVSLSNIISDPMWANVVSLLNFDGTDGSAIVDGKGLTWTPNGTATISTASPLIGTGSLSLDGSSTSYIASSSNPNFAFGTSDFTVEWFAKQTSTKNISHIDFRAGTASSSALMTYNSTASPYTDIRLYVNGADRIVAPSGTLIIGQRQHFAICRSGGITRMFVDGVQVGSNWTDSTNYAAFDWTVGANTVTTTRAFNGQIDGFRATKAARYTTTFTPPTSPFPTQ